MRTDFARVDCQDIGGTRQLQHLENRAIDELRGSQDAITREAKRRCYGFELLRRQWCDRRLQRRERWDGAAYIDIDDADAAARHPNFAGVVVVGLGCEANQVGAMFMVEGIETGKMITPLVIQDKGGTKNTVAAAIAAIEDMLPWANECRRQPVPVSNLVVALQCGGSDGYSGITANPALGVAVDMLVAQGGTAILSETPEIYGAEHLLTRRAVSREVGEKIVSLIKWWEGYAEREKGSIDNNPTPGNKAGGLTRILEKSLGAVAKSGSTPLTGVYRYAEPIKDRGLVFMDTPGYDPMGTTGQIAGGANLVAFTTGRGSCIGAKPSPSVKLATNTKMFARMRDDMDINCGDIMDGDSTIESKDLKIYRKLIDVASGKKIQKRRTRHRQRRDCPMDDWYADVIYNTMQECLRSITAFEYRDGDERERAAVIAHSCVSKGRAPRNAWPCDRVFIEFPESGHLDLSVNSESE